MTLGPYLTIFTMWFEDRDRDRDRSFPCKRSKDRSSKNSIFFTTLELRNATFEGKKHQTQPHRSHAWWSTSARVGIQPLNDCVRSSWSHAAGQVVQVCNDAAMPEVSVSVRGNRGCGISISLTLSLPFFHMQPELVSGLTINLVHLPALACRYRMWWWWVPDRQSHTNIGHTSLWI